MIKINKIIIIAALTISIAALAFTPLFQSTGMATEPLAKEKLPKSFFIQEVVVQSGLLEFLNITKTVQS